MKSAIVLGASSGIGRELAKLLSQKGYKVGLTARRHDLLASLQQELPHPSVIKKMDVSRASDAMYQLNELIKEMQGVELIIISAGIGTINPEFDWQKEADTIETNVVGFAAVANVAVRHFMQQGSGHLIGISSIAALRGSDASPAYYASKAFEANYLQGLRKKMAKLHLPITITDVQPGLVDTAMAQGEGLFWVAPAEKAAQQIYDAISKKKEHIYVTKRWRLIAWLIKGMPAYLYNKM
jgi:short-subunit dehydrogenase